MKTQSTFVASTSLLKAKADNLFGTSLELSFSGIPENKAYTLWKDLSKELSILEKVFDAENPASEVSVLNSSKIDLETSDIMKEALNLCESYLIKTQGLFNINRLPGEALDFSGFVKAYSIQRLCAILKKAKVKNYFINFGGSVLCASGDQPYCQGWYYTLYDDAGEEELEEFVISNESLAFSRFEDKTCLVRSKDPIEAKVLSLVLPVASSSQRHEMSYSFKKLDEKYYLR